MVEIEFFLDAGADEAVVQAYIRTLDETGRTGEAGQIVFAIDLLAETDAAHLSALSITRRIDSRDDIWELKAGSHRVAYAVVDNAWILLHAWRKKGQKLDTRQRNIARRHLRRYLG